MTNVTGNFSDDMCKYVVTVPPLPMTVAGVEITLPAVVFEFDTGSSTTPTDVAGVLQSYVGKCSPVPPDRPAYLCKWLRNNTDLEEGVTSAFERALVADSINTSLDGFVAATLNLDLGRGHKPTNELRLAWARHCITTLLSTPSPRNKEMNDKHNHRLLRPAKLKDLQIGDVLILKNSSPVSKSSVTYVANKFVVLRYRDGSEGTCYQSRLEIDYVLAPLCWVEGRPVYPGDGPLYYKVDPAWVYNKEGVVASLIRGDCLWCKGGQGLPINDVTWTKPWSERVSTFQVEGQDVYPGDVVYYYGVDKDSWGCPHTVKENGRVVHQRTGSVGPVDLFDGGAEAFRLKPQLVIGDRLVPMPECEAPAKGTAYFTPSLYTQTYFTEYCWADETLDLRWLERGLVHLTKEAAIAHGQALVALSKKKD